ncbi:MAG: hypothetical protein ACK5N9_23335 [Pirellula sp.]
MGLSEIDEMNRPESQETVNRHLVRMTNRWENTPDDPTIQPYDPDSPTIME